MFGLGFAELLIIVVATIVFFGPQKLPEVMRQLGKFFAHARRVSNEVKASFEDAVAEAEREIEIKEMKERMARELKHATTLLEANSPRDRSSSLSAESEEEQASTSPFGRSESFSPQAEWPHPQAPLPMEPSVDSGQPSPPLP